MSAGACVSLKINYFLTEDYAVGIRALVYGYQYEQIESMDSLTFTIISNGNFSTSWVFGIFRVFCETIFFHCFGHDNEIFKFNFRQT
jgi:hypothetical protein